MALCYNNLSLSGVAKSQLQIVLSTFVIGTVYFDIPRQKPINRKTVEEFAMSHQTLSALVGSGDETYAPYQSGPPFWSNLMIKLLQTSLAVSDLTGLGFSVACLFIYVYVLLMKTTLCVKSCCNSEVQVGGGETAKTV